MGVVARALRDAPSGHWVVRQTLHDVLHVHWPVPASALAPYVPLPVDTYGGTAWITVSAFDVSNLRLRLMPRVPGLDAYAALTVRTYVTDDHRGGVYYLSLDVTNPITVLLGRWARHLPYHHAWATLGSRNSTQFFYIRRRGDQQPPAQFSTHYGPTSAIYTAERSSLAEFLLERYFVYTSAGSGELLRAELYHRPWPLQDASARIALSGLLPDSLRLPPAAPLLHYCERLDMRAWPLERVRILRPPARDRGRGASAQSHLEQ